MADSERKPENFKVTDRRAFDTTGERKTDAPDAQVKTEAPEDRAENKPENKPESTSPEPPRKAPESSRALPPADFATLVLSLGSSAAMYLGDEGKPTSSEKTQRNLPMAKHAIDLLTILEEKTKGNLSPEEEQILESLLFDLRLRYVEALKTAPSSGA
jgi:hypothetical protein